MAANLDIAVKTVANLLADNRSAIELYKANFATPQDLEGMRFWAQGEYNRIQSGFASTDTAVKLIAGVLQDLIDALDEAGIGGGGGEDGTDGVDGQDGRGIRVFQQNPVPSEGQSEPGDVWFVEEFAPPDDVPYTADVRVLDTHSTWVSIVGPQGEPGDSSDVINDEIIDLEHTWSSTKINALLNDKANTADLHSQYHQLYGTDHTDVDTTLPMEDMYILESTPTGFAPDRRTKVHFSATQPPDSDSLQGDLWVITP